MKCNLQYGQNEQKLIHLPTYKNKLSVIWDKQKETVTRNLLLTDVPTYLSAEKRHIKMFQSTEMKNGSK